MYIAFSYAMAPTSRHSSAMGNHHVRWPCNVHASLSGMRRLRVESKPSLTCLQRQLIRHGKVDKARQEFINIRRDLHSHEAQGEFALMRAQIEYESKY